MARMECHSSSTAARAATGGMLPNALNLWHRTELTAYAGFYETQHLKDLESCFTRVARSFKTRAAALDPNDTRIPMVRGEHEALGRLVKRLQGVGISFGRFGITFGPNASAVVARDMAAAAQLFLRVFDGPQIFSIAKAIWMLDRPWQRHSAESLDRVHWLQRHTAESLDRLAGQRRRAEGSHLAARHSASRYWDAFRSSTLEYPNLLSEQLSTHMNRQATGCRNGKHLHTREPLGSTTASLLQQLQYQGYATVDSWAQHGIDIDALSRDLLRIPARTMGAYAPKIPALERLLHNGTSLQRALQAYLVGSSSSGGGIGNSGSGLDVRYDGYLLSIVSAEWSEHRSKANWPAGLWHHDRCGRRVKAFIYLSNVRGHRPSHRAPLCLSCSAPLPYALSTQCTNRVLPYAHAAN